MRPQVYVDPRPPEYFERFHARARRRDPGLVYELVRLLLAPITVVLYRVRALHTERVPRRGASIIAPNHFSLLDHFFIAIPTRRRLHFMGKSQIFRPPLQWVFANGGVFPVRRGRRDQEAFVTAHVILERGGAILMYPEAGRSRTRELGRPRPGVGRLALETGAPVVPAAIGSVGVRDWRRGRFPRVNVNYGEPMRFEPVIEPTREQAQACSMAIFERVRALYAELQGAEAAVGEAPAPLVHEPTHERARLVAPAPDPASPVRDEPEQASAA